MQYLKGSFNSSCVSSS